MFGLTFLALLAIVIWQTWRSKNPKRGLGIAMLAAFAVPVWAYLGYHNTAAGAEVSGNEIDAKLAISFVGLFFLAFNWRSILPLKPHWLDLIMLCLVSINIMSDTWHDGFTAWLPIRVFGEWILPYLIGRVIVCDLNDILGLLTTGALVCTILAIVGSVEVLTGVNVMELIYGIRPEDGARRKMARWGFKRAFAPTMHPIYFGVLQVLLFPWTIYAATRSARSGRGIWRMGTPVASVLGIITSLSRGPMLGILVFGYLFAVFNSKRMRYTLLIVGGILVAILFVQRDQVLIMIQESTNEIDARKQRTVIVNEQEIRITSTRSRLILVELYGFALKRAGWLAGLRNRKSHRVSGTGSSRCAGSGDTCPRSCHRQRVRADDAAFRLRRADGVHNAVRRDCLDIRHAGDHSATWRRVLRRDGCVRSHHDAAYSDSLDAARLWLRAGDVRRHRSRFTESTSAGWFFNTVIRLGRLRRSFS